LAIVQVGDREDSNVYIRQKQKFGEEIGVGVILKKFEPASVEALAGEVEKLNKDKNINGIIVQLPLPEGFDTEKVLNIIDKNKDTDGLTFGSKVVPATARGVMTLLDYYEIKVKGKKVAAIGQSILAGKPIADELEKRGAQVFRCDINTKNIPEVARECDILVSAVGKAGLITKEFVNDKQVVVDVGISKINNDVAPMLRSERPASGGRTKLVGDVNFAEVLPLVAAITPVPGGIGPLTVACLFENLLDLCE
jgi:methylenetetrahydrofolate dehydrogenase (NADP+)/methenyltetrahydrofolate cyclohydrolase